MDKIMKKMVMNLKCKYRPKHNIQAYKLTLDLCSRLLLTSLIHSVTWQEINHLSLYYTFQNCIYTREKFYNTIIVGPQLSI